MTNLEKIRTSSREDLAKFLCDLFSADGCYEKCPGSRHCRFGHKGLLYWLDMEENECDE